MQLQNFLRQLQQNPDEIQFDDTIAVIDAHYNFTPCSFQNGEVFNSAGQNSGSCKLLAFAKQQNLSKAETLSCFGAFYRNDVLNNPTGNDHQNIRNFMHSGWTGVKFDGEPLKVRDQASN